MRDCPPGPRRTLPFIPHAPAVTHAIGQARARSLIQEFSGRRVVVVGDVMLDHFLFGRVQRLSPEAPVPIVEYDHDDYRPGGAANVAMNLAALGASVALVGVVGDDEAAGQLRERLAVGGVDPEDL